MKVENLNFIRLGSRYKWLKTLGICEPFDLLNHAQKSRLPVPNGILLLERAWAQLQADGVVTFVQDDRDDVAVSGIEPFLEPLALLHQRERLVEIRPQFPTSRPITLINIADQAELVRVLVELWQSDSPDLDGQLRRDILILDGVDNLTGTDVVRGTAVTRATDQHDLIIPSDQESQPLPRYKLFAKAPKIGWERRLQRLLDGVRRSLNLRGDNWQIEWVDDGRVCWLVAVKESMEESMNDDV